MSVSSPDSPSSQAGGPIRLNGWKEIASYLDRGIRTVQRWEKDFNLPVRRLGSGRGEGVFAFAHELDDWQATPVADRARQASPMATLDTAALDDALATSPEAESDSDAAHRRMKTALVALASVAVFLVIWASWSTWRVLEGTPTRPQPATGEPASLIVDVDTLVVSDAEHRTLWRHRFSVRLEEARYSWPSPRFGRLAGVDDVDGDGRREVWCLVMPTEGYGSEPVKLYLFEGNGTLRWTYQFTGEATFGRVHFDAPWRASQVFLTQDPAGGRGRVMWVASHDRALFPAVLQRIDSRTGEPLSSYWSNGHITAVALAPLNGRLMLLVGACHNESKGSSLAMLDALNSNGVAPAEKAEYRCTSCAGGDPERFIVFPKPARFGHLDVSGAVFSILAADNQITLVVNHGRSQSQLLASGVYTLDASLRPIAVALADEYATAFQALVKEGSVPPGAPEHVDPEREFLPILRWEHGRYLPVRKAPESR